MFPATQYSAVQLAASDDPEERARSISILAAVYYRPVYLHLRQKWRLDAAQAEDATQAFFAAVVERNVFAAYRAERGRFRSFVRTCLDHLVGGELRSARRLKRGGDKRFVPIDSATLETELADSGPAADPERVFEAEFVRALFASSVALLEERLVRAGKAGYFAIFAAYDLASPEERPSYAAVAERFQLSTTDVTNHLFFARKELRRSVVARLRELTSSEEELREEAADLGIDLEGVR